MKRRYFKIPPELVDGDAWSIIDLDRTDTLVQAVHAWGEEFGMLESEARRAVMVPLQLIDVETCPIDTEFEIKLGDMATTVGFVEMTDAEVEAMPEL